MIKKGRLPIFITVFLCGLAVLLAGSVVFAQDDYRVYSYP